MDSRNLSICFRKGNSGEVEESEDLFKDGIRYTTSGEGSRKRRKSLFRPTVFHSTSPHLEDLETQNNLSTRRNDDEEEANNWQEEGKNCLEMFEKEVKHNFLRGVITADFATEKMDNTDVDEDNCFLLSLLPSFRQFNNEKKFLARMEILKIMRHVKLE